MSLTPLRSVRIATPLWEAAQIRADETCTTVTAVLVAALEQFTDRQAPDVAVFDDAADEQERSDLLGDPPSRRVL